MNRKKANSTLFHRRLGLLALAFATVVVLMAGQTYRLTVVEGAERRAAAEDKLNLRRFLPTYRGRILDRHGRVLAMDRASFDVAIEYDVLTGAWLEKQAAREARQDSGRVKWAAMSPADREAAITARLPHWHAVRESLNKELCEQGGITRDELQERIDAIKAQVQSTAASVWDRQRAREREKFGIPDDQEYKFKAQPIREQSQPHVILPRVAEEVAFHFRRLSMDLPDMIVVQDSRSREYPWLSANVPLSRETLPRPIRTHDTITVQVIGVADHIIGSVRDEVWAEDLKRRPFRNPKTKEIDLGGYLPGDVVGTRGIERVFEDALRGLRGEIRQRRDTLVEDRIDPTPGSDVHLTIDIALQARIQALLSPQFGLTVVQPWHNNQAMPFGTQLDSAVVVIEVATGEILAMVSYPTLAMGESMSPEEQERRGIFTNRPAEAVYPPGSTIKPLVLAAAVTEGVQSLHSPIECTGHFFENSPTTARCWIYRERFGIATHGMLRAEEAIARSCNIYYYTLGDRLGLERLSRWLVQFGLGSPLNVGLRHPLMKPDGSIVWVGENGGQIPNESDIAKFRAAGELKFNQIILGIGQGPITWTPLQAANAYATLARRGIIRDATLVQNYIRESQRQQDLSIQGEVVKAALDGLRDSVVEPYGTSHHMTLDDGSQIPVVDANGVTIWAKTGTAQADRTRGLDHSWFVALVGPADSSEPMYAIAAIVEHGGSGGRVAGPVGNQVIRALQAEGYLPGDSESISPWVPPSDSSSEPGDESE